VTDMRGNLSVSINKRQIKLSFIGMQYTTQHFTIEIYELIYVIEYILSMT